MTDTLIEQLQHEVDRLEAHKLHDPKRLNADALGQIAGLNTAIAIIRQHQAKQPEERGAQNATGAQETGAARTAASNTLNQIIACPMCKRDTPCSYWQGWNQNIDCKGCGFHSSGPILGEPPNVVRSEIPLGYYTITEMEDAVDRGVKAITQQREIPLLDENQLHSIMWEFCKHEYNEISGNWNWGSICRCLIGVIRPYLREPKREAQPSEISLLDPNMSEQGLRLHMGEMTAQEARTARAAIRWANSVTQGKTLVNARPEREAGNQPYVATRLLRDMVIAFALHNSTAHGRSGCGCYDAGLQLLK